MLMNFSHSMKAAQKIIEDRSPELISEYRERLLAKLKELLDVASDRDYYRKEAPPLSLHQREVWSRLNEEIGKMIGGYLQSLEEGSVDKSEGTG